MKVLDEGCRWYYTDGGRSIAFSLCLYDIEIENVSALSSSGMLEISLAC